MFDPQPVKLQHALVELWPLTLDHVDDLAAAGQDERIWPHLACPPVQNEANARLFIEGALESSRPGNEIPFAIVDPSTQRAIGSTRYLAIRRPHRSLEIGWTWLSASHWRSGVNRACKLLLLTHAFEDLGALRVEFKTDARNQRSQTALEGLGAKREGTLRSHMLMPDGYRRDSVYFSVLDKEWPAVRDRLALLLEGD